MVAMRLIQFLQSLATDTNPHVHTAWIQFNITSAVQLHVWNSHPPAVSIRCGSEARTVIGDPFEVSDFEPMNHGDMWRTIIDAWDHDPEAVATNLAWALRLEMQQKAVEADARLDAITAKLNTISQRIDDAFRNVTLND